MARVGIYLAGMIFIVFLPDRPENYMILTGIIAVFGIYFAFTRLKNNKEYSGKNYLRLRHENDNLEKLLSFSLAAMLFIGSAWYVVVAGQFATGTLVCSMLGLLLFFNGITYQKTVVLKKEKSRITRVDEPEFQIDTRKVDKLTIHLNQIIAEKADMEQALMIQFLRLKNEEIDEIKKWFLEITVPQEG